MKNNQKGSILSSVILLVIGVGIVGYLYTKYVKSDQISPTQATNILPTTSNNVSTTNSDCNRYVTADEVAGVMGLSKQLTLDIKSVPTLHECVITWNDASNGGGINIANVGSGAKQATETTCTSVKEKSINIGDASCKLTMGVGGIMFAKGNYSVAIMRSSQGDITEGYVNLAKLIASKL